MIYVDEAGINEYLYREYCYAPTGETVTGRICGRKFARKSVVAGQRNGEILAPMLYEGMMDSILFEDWFERWLIPASGPEDVFIMDNASFHRKKQLLAICERHHRKVIFLPPYSPELNPIEKFWAWLKKKLRAVLPQHNSFEDAMCFVFQNI